MESELQCPICNYEYSEQKQPRILSTCGHTFCESCISTKIFQKGQDKYQIICPEDNIECQLTNPNPKQFPINRSLVRIAECNKSKTSFRETSLDTSKITKEEQLQEDEDARQLRTVIKQTQLSQTTTNTECPKQILPADLKENESQDEQNLCLLHQKPLEIVCVLDLERICAKCAIFGEHKGHEFKSIEQIEQQKGLFYQQLLAVYDQKTEILKRIQNKTTKPDIMSILNSKKEFISKQVKQKFKKLIEAIKNEEKKALAKLQKMSQKIQKVIDDLYIIDRETIEQYEGWERISFDKLQVIEEGTFENQLQMLLKIENKPQNNTITKGRQIIDKIRLHQENIIIQAENFLSNVRIKSTDEIFNIIQSYVEVLDKPEIQQKDLDHKFKIDGQPIIQINVARKEKAQNHSMKKCFEDNLLEMELITEETVKIQKVQFVTEPLKTLESIDIKIEEVKITPCLDGNAFEQSPAKKSQKKLMINSQAQNLSKISQGSKQPMSQLTSRDNSFISESTVRPSKKKLKTIKVPQKYEKILDSLYADTIQTLDLTNAQLGDLAMSQICQYLVGSKVKTVKLIRNKLTDDGLAKILPYMQNVVTMNLSQNMYTEKVLDILVSNRQKLPKVKNIILSMNKIIERKHKNKIDELRKLQITVSV